MGLLTEKYNAWARHPDNYTAEQVLNEIVADLKWLDEEQAKNSSPVEKIDDNYSEMINDINCYKKCGNTQPSGGEDNICLNCGSSINNNNKINELGKSKYFANRGVARHKHPIANLIYKVEIVQLLKDADVAQYEKYKFKDLGYLTLSWTKSKADKNGEFQWNWHGFITVDELKEKIGEKQYCKFCQGKREFIIQRRINGKNVSLNNKQN